MLKTFKTIQAQDREKFVAPESWDDGIFLVGKNKYSKMFRFDDVNYSSASDEEKAMMTAQYAKILNSFDVGATSKITINNRRMNMDDFTGRILLDMRDDGLDSYRREYNRMLLDKAESANSIMQEKYVTVSACKRSIEEARLYFARVFASLFAQFKQIGSTCEELNAEQRLRLLHDFFHPGEETQFGHDFRDAIVPDSFEFFSDYFKFGDRFGRVLYLKDYANRINDELIANLCELNRNLIGNMNTFAHQTNVNTNNHVVCYDIHELGKNLQSAGMLIVLDSILNRITRNRKRKRNTYIFIDEIYLMFQNEYSANFLHTLWKRVRKYGAFCTGITQNVEDLLQSHTARTMLSNSELLVMLNQSGNDMDRLAELLNISNTQRSFMENVGPGQGLLKVGSSLVPFVNQFPTNTSLYKLMSTKINE